MDCSILGFGSAGYLSQMQALILERGEGMSGMSKKEVKRCEMGVVERKGEGMWDR